MYIIKITTQSGKVYYCSENLYLVTDKSKAYKYSTESDASQDLDCSHIQATQGGLLEWNEEKQDYMYDTDIIQIDSGIDNIDFKEELEDKLLCLKDTKIDWIHKYQARDYLPKSLIDDELFEKFWEFYIGVYDMPMEKSINNALVEFAKQQKQTYIIVKIKGKEKENVGVYDNFSKAQNICLSLRNGCVLGLEKQLSDDDFNDCEYIPECDFNVWYYVKTTK